MTVYFIGAGPGDPELITVRGLRLIESCKLCLYAGSLVPEAIVAAAPADATVIDTAPLTLDDIIAEIETAHEAGLDIARVHSGDPSLYGAIAEQIRRLKALDIDYKIVPGVSAYAAAAAGLGIELTVPEVTQSLIPDAHSDEVIGDACGEELSSLGQTGATLAIHLSIRNLRQIERDPTPFYGADRPVIVAYRAGWPDEAYLHATLSTVHKAVQKEKITSHCIDFCRSWP